MNSSIFVVIVAVLFFVELRTLGQAQYCSENPNPCLNEGTCVSQGFSYRCSCPLSCLEGGSHCEGCIPGPCTPNPCKRDCTCRESCQHAGGYYCRSASGFLGKNCTVPIPTLICDVDRIVFSVSESFVREYDLGLRNSFINVASSMQSREKCEISRAVNGAYEIQIPLPFTACGTQVIEDSGSLVFSNQMWFNRRLANSMFDMPIPVASFRCRYERQYSVVTSIRPIVSTPTTITGRNDIFPEISLCKAPSCPSACPENLSVKGGAVYTIGEMIHVSMVLDSGNGVTGVENMFLSCSRNPVSGSTVPVVTNGCAASSGLPSQIRASAATNVVCVSFQTPRSLSCQEFFIHAKLDSCERSDVVVCPGMSAKCSSSRRKRSLNSSPVVVGPILLLFNASAGIPIVEVNGMEDYEQSAAHSYELPNQKRAMRVELPSQRNVSVPQSSWSVPVVVIGVVAAMLIALLLIILLVRRQFILK